MDPVQLLQISTSPIFAYFSDRILSRTAVQAKDIFRIARSAFAVLGLIFIFCFRQGWIYLKQVVGLAHAFKSVRGC